MQFEFYPKHDFGCLHVNHCPHLGGAALGWLVLAANEQTEWTDSLLRRIDALQAEDTAKSHKIMELAAGVEQLKRELKAERQKQFKRKKEETAEDEADSTASPGKKKRGAPVGHPGWYRKRPSEFDQLVLVPVPCHCPYCDGSVKARPDRPADDHLQEDWIHGQRVVTCFRHTAGRCTNPKCRRWVQQAGLGELPRKMIGPHVRAAAMFLQYDIGLTTRKVVRTVAGLVACFKPGSTWGPPRRPRSSLETQCQLFSAARIAMAGIRASAILNVPVGLGLGVLVVVDAAARVDALEASHVPSGWPVADRPGVDRLDGRRGHLRCTGRPPRHDRRPGRRGPAWPPPW